METNYNDEAFKFDDLIFQNEYYNNANNNPLRDENIVNIIEGSSNNPFNTPMSPYITKEATLKPIIEVSINEEESSSSRNERKKSNNVNPFNTIESKTPITIDQTVSPAISNDQQRELNNLPNSKLFTPTPDIIRENNPLGKVITKSKTVKREKKVIDRKSVV